MTKGNSPSRFVAQTDEDRVAEAKRFTRARKARERAALTREHYKKMLEAHRSGNKDELSRLRGINPLSKPTKRQLQRRCRGLDIFSGKQVSLTYVSDVAMDNCTNWLGMEAFEGVHRFQVERPQTDGRAAGAEAWRLNRIINGKENVQRHLRQRLKPGPKPRAK